MRLPTFIAAIALFTQTGCLFEPECSTYEECSTPQPNGNSGNSVPNNSSPNSTSPANQQASNNVVTTNNVATGETCDSADECPESDLFSIGGTRDEPLGCSRSGNLAFFEFDDESTVCEGRSRGYSGWLEACENPYIVEVSVQVLDMCVGDLELDFAFDGFTCDQPNTRCTSSENEALVQFIISDDEFTSQELSFDVNAGQGGFSYLLNVRSRR